MEALIGVMIFFGLIGIVFLATFPCRSINDYYQCKCNRFWWHIGDHSIRYELDGVAMGARWKR